MKSIPHKGTSSRLSVCPIKTESVLLRSPAAQSRFEIFVLSLPELLYGSVKWETHPGGCSGSTDSVLVKTLSPAWLWSAFPGVFVVAANPDGDQHVRSIFHPLNFTELSRCEKRFGKWITMSKIINIMNPVQNQLFPAIVLKKMEGETGVKRLRFTHLPLPSEEIKLLNSVDLPTYVWNLMVFIVLDFLFSWGINVFRALPSSSPLIVVIRPLKWFSADVDCQYFTFSSWWDRNSARTSARSVDPWDPHTSLPSSDVKTT